MSHSKIHITGAAGSGTSTLGRNLAKELDFVQIETDDYFHIPTEPMYRFQRPKEKRLELLASDLSQITSGWVLSGGILGWGETPKIDFDLVVFLYVPTEIRIERLKARERDKFGNRILPGGDMHEEHLEFIEWASKYDEGGVGSRTLQMHESYLEGLSCPIVKLEGDMPSEDVVKRVVNEL